MWRNFSVAKFFKAQTCWREFFLVHSNSHSSSFPPRGTRRKINNFKLHHLISAVVKGERRVSSNHSLLSDSFSRRYQTAEIAIKLRRQKSLAEKRYRIRNCYNQRSRSRNDESNSTTSWPLRIIWRKNL